MIKHETLITLIGFCAVLCMVLTTHSEKIVGLVPARNEGMIIEQCLRALACYTDAIVYLDDASDDESLAIVRSLAQECHVETIITKDTWHRDEGSDRQRLLVEGRKIGGTHFIVLDADELFTANCMQDNYLKKTITNLKPGESLYLNWIALWRSVDYYRYDNFVWTNNYKGFIFCDDGRCSYDTEFLHTARIPTSLRGRTHQINGYTYGVLHFQFVNWYNLLVKQSWYRCLERVRNTRPCDKINEAYSLSKNETNLHCEKSSVNWFSYPFFDPSIYDKPETWRKKMILDWFEKYGRDYFKDLDIWDVDWSPTVS